MPHSPDPRAKRPHLPLGKESSHDVPIGHQPGTYLRNGRFYVFRFGSNLVHARIISSRGTQPPFDGLADQAIPQSPPRRKAGKDLVELLSDNRRSVRSGCVRAHSARSCQGKHRGRSISVGKRAGAGEVESGIKPPSLSYKYFRTSGLIHRAPGAIPPMIAGIGGVR